MKRFGEPPSWGFREAAAEGQDQPMSAALLKGLFPATAGAGLRRKLAAARAAA